MRIRSSNPESAIQSRFRNSLRPFPRGLGLVRRGWQIVDLCREVLDQVVDDRPSPTARPRVGRRRPAPAGAGTRRRPSTPPLSVRCRGGRGSWDRGSSRRGPARSTSRPAATTRLTKSRSVKIPTSRPPLFEQRRNPCGARSSAARPARRSRPGSRRTGCAACSRLSGSERSDLASVVAIGAWPFTACHRVIPVGSKSSARRGAFNAEPRGPGMMPGSESGPQSLATAACAQPTPPRRTRATELSLSQTCRQIA